MQTVAKILALPLLLASAINFAGADAISASEARYYWHQSDSLLKIELYDRDQVENGAERERLDAREQMWESTRDATYGKPSEFENTPAQAQKFINLERATVIRTLAVKNLDVNDRPSVSDTDAYQAWKNTDDLLNVEYQELVKLHEGDALRTLKRRQEDWVATRNASWGDPDDSSDASDEKYIALEQVTITRIIYLKAYTGDRVYQGLAGNYTDSVGGQLAIGRVQGTVDQYLANLTIERGRDHNSGEKSARLVVSESKGNSERGSLHLDGGCVVDFVRVNHSIELHEVSGCGADHGYNARFDGLYLKSDFKALQ